MSTDSTKTIDLRNVHLLTTYELRQELVRRMAFDFKDEDTVNHRSMLERLIKELVKDEEKKTNDKVVALEDERRAARELAKKQREDKKREALDKSKARQSDPEYFKKIAELNVKPIPTESLEVVEQVDTEDSSENSNQTATNDPFRIDAKRRSKIFVK